MMHYCSKCNAIQVFEHIHYECGDTGLLLEVYACMVCGRQIEFAVA